MLQDRACRAPTGSLAGLGRAAWRLSLNMAKVGQWPRSGGSGERMPAVHALGCQRTAARRMRRQALGMWSARTFWPDPTWLEAGHGRLTPATRERCEAVAQADRDDAVNQKPTSFL